MVVIKERATIKDAIRNIIPTAARKEFEAVIHKSYHLYVEPEAMRHGF